jgi:4-hydroxy-tetrahydrodipicolinate synthase
MKPIDLQKKLKNGGVSYMVVTPFKEDQTVDYDGFKENVKFLVEKVKKFGFNDCTITPAGSNGEFAHLTDEEHRKVIMTCVDVVDRQMTVVAGTGRASSYASVLMSKYAEEIGADGVQVILPYYFIPTEQGMYDHYANIASNVNIGMIVYNNPAFTGSWIKPPLMKRMIEGFGANGKIAGVKENTPHLMLFNAMSKMLSKTEVALHSGFGEQWYAYQFPWGANGLATPFGNFFPEYPMEIYKAAKEFDFDKIRNWLNKMEPYYAFVGRCTAARMDTGILPKPGGSIYGEGNIRFAVVKAAMNLMGLHGGRMRLPIEDINQKEKDELKEILQQLKLV